MSYRYSSGLSEFCSPPLLKPSGITSQALLSGCFAEVDSQELLWAVKPEHLSPTRSVADPGPIMGFFLTANLRVMKSPREG